MKTLIIGLDAFDPQVFEKLNDQGGMPHLARLAGAGGYSRLSISNPAQSEVSWTSIATGVNPGAHGLFDFVHRDPQTYTLTVSLLPTESGLFGTQFVPPHGARTLFEQATRRGYPATSLWWPATFPARIESPVRTLPGLGAPDILGRLGVGSVYTTDPELGKEGFKTSVELLDTLGKDRYASSLRGPSQKKRGDGTKEATEGFVLEIRDESSAQLAFGNQKLELRKGEWTPILQISFKMGLLMRVHAITRAILTHTLPEPRLYFLPLQIHPLHSPWRYASPKSFASETWNSVGPYLTLGWPQDTTGLEEGWIDDGQFLSLCESIVERREQIAEFHLRRFREGVFAAVFDTLDRVQHMFWRDRPDVIERWYARLDSTVGRLQEALREAGQKDTRVLVMSDHGFSRFDYKVHLNRWLVEHGYLSNGSSLEADGLRRVSWAESKAYAVGLNSIYLNLQNREGKGSVPPSERERLSFELRTDLLDWKGPDGRPVVQQVWLQEEAFQGPLAEYGPDLVVGFSPGYRASQQTGLGGWREQAVEPNTDHWGADHCIDPEAVPGVLFSSSGLQNHPSPSYQDIPILAIGTPVDPNAAPPPPPRMSDEDQEVLEERLKSLGYL